MKLRKLQPAVEQGLSIELATDESACIYRSSAGEYVFFNAGRETVFETFDALVSRIGGICPMKGWIIASPAPKPEGYKEGYKVHSLRREQGGEQRTTPPNEQIVCHCTTCNGARALLALHDQSLDEHPF